VTVSAGATFEYNRSNSSNVDNVFSGTGNIVNTAGTAIYRGNSSGFTGNATINGGTLRLEKKLATTHKFNAPLITVNTGGTFEFGLGGSNNPNLPASTLTVNTGGVATFEVGENFGSLNLLGGTLNQAGVNINLDTLYNLQSGSINGTTGTNNLNGTAEM